MRIGIDFGTSFSLPAALINNNPATLLSGGQYGVPSVFYYDKRQDILIGKPAENRGKFRPENVIRNVKMEISNPNAKTFKLDGKIFNKKQQSKLSVSTIPNFLAILYGGFMDRRQRKSREAIFRAFEELLKKRGFYAQLYQSQFAH